MNPQREYTCPVCGTKAWRRSETCQQCIHINPAAVPGNWVDYAACAEVDGDVFFPDTNETAHGYREAKAICASCPVAAQCLQYAIDNNVRHGTWGGTSPAERGRLRRAAG